MTVQDWLQESPVLRLSKVLLAALDPILQIYLLLAAPSITSGLCIFSSHAALLSFDERSRHLKSFFLIDGLIFTEFLVTSLHPWRQHRPACGLARGSGSPAAVPVAGTLAPESQHSHRSSFCTHVLCSQALTRTEPAWNVLFKFYLFVLCPFTAESVPSPSSCHNAEGWPAKPGGGGYKEESTVWDRVRRQVAVTNASITTKYFFPWNHSFRQRHKTFT